MPEVRAIPPRDRPSLYLLVRRAFPTPREAALSLAAAILTVLSFPNFNLWFLAWVGLAPLLIAIVSTRTHFRAFVLGWLYGIVFFYGTCWWLTYPMIHYAHISAWFAYPLFLLPVGFVACFPALFCAALSLLIRRLGPAAVYFGPPLWVSIEWLRYVVTGQLWNAIGYSQSFHPILIQSARWGGVYAVSFLIVFVNVAVATVLIRRTFFVAAACVVLVVIALIACSQLLNHPERVRRDLTDASFVRVIAIQPNVPMDTGGDPGKMGELLDRHLSLSVAALNKLNTDRAASFPRLVIWPESPMNFTYSRDLKLQEVVGSLARANRTAVLLNSLEPASGGGDQNSAVLVNEEGVIAARYDKIRLMPFGEYVPLPRWLPGASSVRGLVGEFTPGSSYTLMPLGAFRAGVFICIEAAHPTIARTFTQGGADVLINISNDGYLGPTAVMRQHLSNAIFRAVENDRDIVRVTNSGISAYIKSNGQITDETSGFETDVRTWTISRSGAGTTFYSRRGDLFVYFCGLIAVAVISASFIKRSMSESRA